jgi:hypothetical protein
MPKLWKKLALGEGVLGVVTITAAVFAVIAFTMVLSGSSDSSVGWTSSGENRTGYAFAVGGRGLDGQAKEQDTCQRLCAREKKGSFCVQYCNNGACGQTPYGGCDDPADSNDVCICMSQKPNNLKRQLAI